MDSFVGAAGTKKKRAGGEKPPLAGQAVEGLKLLFRHGRACPGHP